MSGACPHLEDTWTCDWKDIQQRQRPAVGGCQPNGDPAAGAIPGTVPTGSNRRDQLGGILTACHEVDPLA